MASTATDVAGEVLYRLPGVYEAKDNERRDALAATMSATVQGGAGVDTIGVATDI
jgi:hypothetical protein